MNRICLLGLVFSGLLLVGPTGSVRAGLFTGSFDPANWELDAANSSNPGTYVFTGVANAEILEITGAAAGGSDTVVVLKSPSSSPTLLHFTWSVVKKGNDGDPLAYYLLLGEVPTPLTGTSGTVNDLDLPAGTRFGFALSATTTAGKDPAVFAVTDWEAQAVPEAGSWLAGALVLGVALFEVVRRQRRGALVPARA